MVNKSPMFVERTIVVVILLTLALLTVYHIFHQIKQISAIPCLALHAAPHNIMVAWLRAVDLLGILNDRDEVFIWSAHLSSTIKAKGAGKSLPVFHHDGPFPYVAFNDSKIGGDGHLHFMTRGVPLIPSGFSALMCLRVNANTTYGPIFDFIGRDYVIFVAQHEDQPGFMLATAGTRDCDNDAIVVTDLTLTIGMWLVLAVRLLPHMGLLVIQQQNAEMGCPQIRITSEWKASKMPFHSNHSHVLVGKSSIPGEPCSVFDLAELRISDHGMSDKEFNTQFQSMVNLYLI